MAAKQHFIGKIGNTLLIRSYVSTGFKPEFFKFTALTIVLLV